MYADMIQYVGLYVFPELTDPSVSRVSKDPRDLQGTRE